MRKSTVLIVLAFTLFAVAEQPYYLQACAKNDEYVNECLRNSGNKLIKYLQQGIPDLDMFEIEPVLIDEIAIVLGSGPDGYRAIFKNIEAYDVSNLTVTQVRSDIDSFQFQLSYNIPRIRVRAQYRSSGVLILVKASGSGDYWGEYEGVKAKIYFKATPHIRDNGLTYLSVERIKMDFSVKDLKMGVDNIAHGNAVIQAALNLFINSNAQELLKEMKPALREKLTMITKDFMVKLFDKIPVENWLV